MEIVDDLSSQRQSPSAGRISFVYAFLLVTTIVCFFCIQHFGEKLPVRAAAISDLATAAPAKVPVLPHVLLALLAIVVTGRVLGTCCRYLGQPRVIGEVIAGIALGPSLFGRVTPETMTYVFPQTISPILFTMMVLMAPVTTIATTPILRRLLLLPDHDTGDR